MLFRDKNAVDRIDSTDSSHLEKDLSTTACSALNDHSDNVRYRKIQRKLDRRIIGVMGLVIMIEFLDRVGLGFARVAGIDQDLQLHVGHRFSLVVLLGSVAGTVTQVPMILWGSRFHPPYFIGLMCLGWTASLFGIGFSRTWTDLIPCRLFGGAFGAALSQVTYLVIQTWYTRYEVCRRFAWMAVVVYISKAVGGITASGITRMAGVGGLSGWRWIYIWSGILTTLAALVAFTLTVGYADTDKWRPLVGSFLSPDERTLVLSRLERDRGDSRRQTFSYRLVLSYSKDPKLWLFGLIALATHSIMTSLAIFSPVIMHHDFGFDAARAQALYAPPYVFTALCLIAVSELSDRTRHRGACIVGCTLLSVLGLVLVGFTRPVALRYAGIFLANAGLGATSPLFNAYLANNVRCFHKRSFGTAVLVGCSGVGGIVGSLVFRSQDAPRYLPGLVTSVGLAVLVVVVVGVLSVHFWVENRRQRVSGKVLEGLEGFRYTY